MLLTGLLCFSSDCAYQHQSSMSFQHDSYDDYNNQAYVNQVELKLFLTLKKFIKLLVASKALKYEYYVDLMRVCCIYI